jgi:hypothetical protein
MMDSFKSEMVPKNLRRRVLIQSGTVATFGLFLLWIGSLLFTGTASATTIYSYIDDRGTPVLTDNFESIPERYRAKVRVTEQVSKAAPDHSVAIRVQEKIADLTHSTSAGFGKFTPSISGLTPYQSKVLTFGGIAAVVCLLVRLLMRSQVTQFLSLWCLIMLGLTVPALFLTSQDAPLDRLSGQADKIQEKQLEHLQRTP